MQSLLMYMHVCSVTQGMVYRDLLGEITDLHTLHDIVV